MNAKPPLGIALQMWTVREQMRTDALACIDEVAAAGYDAVELVGYGDAGFDAVRERLAEVGVTAISQHVPYRRLADEFDQVLAEQQGLGSSYLVIQQGRHEDWIDTQAVRDFADTCNRWGRACAAAGLFLGYHGYHELDQEFAPHEGRTRWDLFADLTDPTLVFLQLDTFWVTATGNDPVALIERFAGRVPTLHLKDPAPPGGTDTTVGDGLLDLVGVLEAAQRCGTRYVIVEQEGNPANAYNDIRRSRHNADLALAGTS